ncbi:MAG: PilN domain-containing protein [Nitrospirae bacterium]|nr:PilN domain-containing protein [Nitrospirota bacterium]
MPRLLGLDIDSKYIRMSVADRRLKSITYLRSEGIGLPGDREAGNRALSDALQQWKKDYAPSGVVVGLSLQLFTCKLLDMPAMGREDMRKALLFELEKHLPLAVDEYLFDFLMLKTGNGMKTLVFSIKKDAVSALMKLISDAGMEVASVRCRVADVLNSMIGISGEKNMKGIFVLATDDAYEIVGLEDSLPRSMKRISAGSDLAEALEVFRTAYPGKVYCSGPVDQLIAEHFAMTKSQITVPNALIFSFVHKTRLNLEFIPRELIKQKKDLYPYLIGGLAAAALCLYLLTGFVVYYKDARALSKIESRTETIKSKASGVIEARKKLEALQDDRKTLLAFQNRSNLATRVLKDLTKIVPDNAWIINLVVDEKGLVEIEGFSRKTSDLVMALDSSKLFKNIAFAAPILSRDGEERFSLKFEVSEP